MVASAQIEVSKSKLGWILMLALLAMQYVWMFLIGMKLPDTDWGFATYLVVSTIILLVIVYILISLDFRLRRKWMHEELHRLGLRPQACILCNRDLRGSPNESTTCPECGAAIATVTIQAHDAMAAERSNDPPVIPEAEGSNN